MRQRALPGVVCVLVTGAVTAATAAQLTTVWNFSGTDGINPFDAVTADPSGALYGSADTGGSTGRGTVFRLTPPAQGSPQSTETTLRSFAGSRDGKVALARPLIDSTGALFGTTWSGGIGCTGGGGGGCGIVFRLSPPAAGQERWQEDVLWRFAGGSDGAHPVAALLMDATGSLYGTTEYGGHSCNSGCGTVFKLTPPAAGQTQWSEQILWRFSGASDGLAPESTLIMDAAGALYGTTGAGGGNSCDTDGDHDDNGCGTAFKLSPPSSGQTQWTLATLWRFTGGADGGTPTGGLITDASGALYGTANIGGFASTYYCFGGCGTVFRLTPPAAGQTQWTETTLYSFQNEADGAFPSFFSGLIMDAGGSLYGEAGGRNSYGTIFKVAPPASGQTQWTETALWRFSSNGIDGEYPTGGLTFDGTGGVFGTTSAGGAQGDGTVFQLMP